MEEFFKNVSDFQVYIYTHEMLGCIWFWKVQHFETNENFWNYILGTFLFNWIGTCYECRKKAKYIIQL